MANLTQLKMLEDLNGFLLVDKPAGLAFSSVVKAVKRKFNLVKVGHGGSLDAMASGLMVLLIGEANKFVADVMGADRAYEGTVRFGLRTDTHDVHGRALGESADFAALDDPARLSAALGEFRGDVFQTEPRFCSVRKEGSADYEIADTGEHAQFLAHVYRLELTEPKKAAPGRRLDFSLRSTKGVLVRTLVNDLGDALGCGACLESLRRIAVGRFSVGEAVAFDRLLTTEPADFAGLVQPLSRVLS